MKLPPCFIIMLLAASLFGIIVSRHADSIEISTPQDDGAVFIKLSAEEVASCIAEGGCKVVTRDGLQALVLQACGSKI